MDPGPPIPFPAPPLTATPPAAPLDAAATAAQQRTGIPSTYGPSISWFFNGLFGQPLAVAVALFGAWTGLIVSLWAAVIGLILGIMVAIGILATNSVTQALFHAGAGQSVSIIGIAGGALAGAGGGFIAMYTHELFGKPLNVVVALFSGLILAVVIVVVLATYEGDFLRLRGYRQLSLTEVRRISPLMQQVAKEMRLPDVPRFAMVDNPVPCAWTHMRHVVFTKGLLDTLDDGELAAVMAHELHHWASGDAVAQRFIWACAFPLALIYNLAKYVSGFQLEVKTQGVPVVHHRFLSFIAWMFAWPALVIIRFAIMPAASTGMRACEYRADAAAKDIGRGHDLKRALEKLQFLEGGRTGWEWALTQTHPPVALRIAKLERYRPGDEDYREPALGNIDPAAVKEGGLILVAIIAALLLIGGFVNAHRSGASPSGGSTTATTQPPYQGPGPNTAEAASAANVTTANFISEYFNHLGDPSSYNGAIANYGYTANQNALQRAANSDVQNSSYSFPSSQATAIGCRYDYRKPAENVRIAWQFQGITGPVQTLYFTSTLPLVIVNHAWKIDGIPTLPTPSTADTTNQSVPKGFSPCT